MIFWQEKISFPVDAGFSKSSVTLTYMGPSIQTLARERIFWPALLAYGWMTGMLVFWLCTILLTPELRVAVHVPVLYATVACGFSVPFFLLFFAKSRSVAPIFSLIVSAALLLFPPILILPRNVIDFDQTLRLGLLFSVMWGFGLPLYIPTLIGTLGAKHLPAIVMKICFWVGIIGVSAMIGGCSFVGFWAATNF